MSYPPVGPDGNEGQRQQPQGQPPQQGGWPPADPTATQPMYPPTADYPAAGPVNPGPYNPAPNPGYQQPPYYQEQQQNPYPQQQQPYPYPQGQEQQPGQQPYQQQYQYPYDPNAGGVWGQPPQTPGQGGRSRNGMIAGLVAVAVVAVGVSVYWFGFHGKSANGTPIALTSTLSSSSAAATGQPSDSAQASESPTPNVLGTGDQVGELQALMGTMSDPGCKAAFQALITFEQAAATDANDGLALITDYDNAIASLSSAQAQAQNTSAADAIGRVVTDWKAYTAQLAAGQTPSDATMTSDGEQLAATCLAS